MTPPLVALSRQALRRVLLPAALLLWTCTVQAQGVGIGTTAPDASAALDIVSSNKGALLPRLTAAQRTAIAGPALGLLVFQTDGTQPGFWYNAGSPAAPAWTFLSPAGAGESTTASNGLTRTGTDLALGGALTQPTTVALAGNSLALGNVQSLQISQPVAAGAAGTFSPYGLGQSFTLPAGASITRVDVYDGGGNSGTFTLWQGAPGGPVLATQPVTYAGGAGASSVVLTAPVAVGAAGTYSFSTGISNGAPFAMNYGNPYAGGTAYDGTAVFGAGTADLKFTVYYSLAGTSFYASGSGAVGIGTASPTATLDVSGSTRLRGLGTAGLVQTDASGNLSSSPAAALGAGFVLNQSTQQSSASFNVSGTGVVGTGLSVGANAAPRGTLDVRGGDAYLVADPNAGAGQSVYLPGHLYLAPYSGSSGTAYVQARVPSPSASTNVGLMLRTTSAGALTDAVYLAPTGNVGIGTTSPGARLEVGGQVKITGGNPGAGRVLTSDANGLASWVAPGLPAAAVTGESSLRMLQGIFSASGTIYNGSGYTVSKTGTGMYTVTFTTPFTSIPSVALSISATTAPVLLVNFSGVTNLSIQVVVRNASGTVVDPGIGEFITFMALGAR